MSSAPPQDPWLRLEKLAEKELRLAQEKRFVESHQALLATRAFMASLELPPPPSARPHLLRVKMLRARLEVELRHHQAELAPRLNARQRGRQLRRTYATPTAGRYSVNV